MANSYQLSLSDGTLLGIKAGDPASTPIVVNLAKVMQLDLSPNKTLQTLVVSAEEYIVQNDTKDDCPLYKQTSHQEDLVIRLTECSLVIAQYIQQRGGILLHGALAEINGKAIILAAPGGTGKTTASRRLPLPWHSWSDDMSLIIPCRPGEYWAHPWPTWSRFNNGEVGGSWQTKAAFPLQAVFFLEQSRIESLKTVGKGEAASLLVQSNKQANQGLDYLKKNNQARYDWHKRFENICNLVQTVPVYVLQLSLYGSFWPLIYDVLEG